MKLLNFGSMNIDYVYKVDHFVKKGETISSEAMRKYSGGKGLNQSIALSKAGENVFHAGAVGEDGAFLLDMLKQAGVETGCITVRGEERTGHAIIQNDCMGDNCIIIFGGANQRIGREEVDRVLSGFAQGDFILLQNEISELEYIIRQAHEKGMKIVLNPSPMNSKVLSCPLELVDFFLVNEIEGAALSDSENENDEIILKNLRERFPKARIVMTLGEKGSVYWDGRQVYRQEAVKAEAVDTTAAGDTYTGYFISGIIRGMDTQEILYRASVASAVTVSRAGAAPSIPAQKEVEALMMTYKRKENRYAER